MKRAIALKSVYAIRFYEPLQWETEPIIYPVAKLKEMFAIKDKYKQINDFVRKVIGAAKENPMRQHPIASTLNLSRMGENHRIQIARLCIILSEKTRMPKCVTYNGNCLSLWDIRDRHVRDYLKTPSDSPKLKSRTISRCSEGHRNYCRIYSPSLLFSRGKAETRTIPKRWIIRALEGKVKDLLEKIEKDGMSREILAIADKLGKK